MLICTVQNLSQFISIVLDSMIWSRFAQEKNHHIAIVFSFVLRSNSNLYIFIFISYYIQVKIAMDIYMDYTSCGVATANHVLIEIQTSRTKIG